MKKTVIVIWQRRSWTSMVSGVLHKLGINMVCDEYNATVTSRFNLNWFYEDFDFIKCSETMLKWLFNDEWMMALIDRRNKREIRWVKDVNLLLTWKYWSKYIINPVFVFVDRNVNDIVKSYMNLHKWNIDQTKDIVENNKKLLQHIHENNIKNGILLNYEDLISDKQTNIDRLISFLNIDPTQEQKQSALDHIKTK